MTRTVSISITVEIAGQSKDVIHAEIHPDQIGENLKKVTDQVFRSAGTGVITYLDEDIREHEANGLKVLGTESREFTTIAGKLSYTRRIYRSKEGKRIKPVDELLGLEKYSRRDKNLQEMNCALAGRSNYRETAAISTLLTQKYISPATISRDVKRVGLRLAESDKNSYTEEKGTLRTNVLYGESDGIFVRLQKDKEGKKAAEIRAAITYTGKKWLSGNRKKLTDKMTLTANLLNSDRSAWDSVKDEDVIEESRPECDRYSQNLMEQAFYGLYDPLAELSDVPPQGMEVENSLLHKAMEMEEYLSLRDEVYRRFLHLLEFSFCSVLLLHHDFSCHLAADRDTAFLDINDQISIDFRNDPHRPANNKAEILQVFLHFRTSANFADDVFLAHICQ